MVTLTEDQKQKIADRLSGTSGSYDEKVLEEYGIEEIGDLEEIMGDMGYERCEGCGWWCENSELSEDEEEGLCDDCR